jgi:hypothetical protein
MLPTHKCIATAEAAIPHRDAGLGADVIARVG